MIQVAGQRLPFKNDPCIAAQIKGVGRLGDQRQSGLFAGGLQYLTALVAEGQNANVGGRSFGLLSGDAQIGTEYHPADAGQGIALGFGLGTDVLQRAALADGLQQAVVQPLVGIGQSGKVVGGQAHQCRQHGVFQTGLIHKGLSLCQSVL